MKTMKHILAVLILATGITASAQTHENAKATNTKQPVSKNLRKATTNETVKEKPDTKMKAEEKNTTVPAEKKSETTVPAEKTNATKTPAGTNDKATQKPGAVKMKQVKRPVKLESTPKSGK